MEQDQLKIGLAVSFHKLKNGKVVGLENEVLTIVEIDFKKLATLQLQIK